MNHGQQSRSFLHQRSDEIKTYLQNMNGVVEIHTVPWEVSVRTYGSFGKMEHLFKCDWPSHIEIEFTKFLKFGSAL